MEIHKPKAVHSWRELASEIGVIIVGVLIALSAEQTVEWLHWRSEVRESREALAAELGKDLGARKLRADGYECIARRTADLQRWLDSYQTGHPLTPTVPLGRPATITLSFDAWNVAQTGQVAAHMPIAERISLAGLYGNMRSFDAFQSEDGKVWADLQDFDGETQLDHSDLMRLRGIIAQLVRRNEGFHANWPGIVRRAKDAGVTINAVPSPASYWDDSFCGSLFAKPAGH